MTLSLCPCFPLRCPCPSVPLPNFMSKCSSTFSISQCPFFIAWVPQALSSEGNVDRGRAARQIFHQPCPSDPLPVSMPQCPSTIGHVLVSLSRSPCPCVPIHCPFSIVHDLVSLSQSPCPSVPLHCPWHALMS